MTDGKLVSVSPPPKVVRFTREGPRYTSKNGMLYTWQELGDAVRQKLPTLPHASDVLQIAADDLEYGRLVHLFESLSHVQYAAAGLPLAVQVTEDGPVTLHVSEINYLIPDVNAFIV